MAQLTLSGPTLLPDGEIAPATLTLDGETIRDVVPGYDARAGLTTGGVIAPGFIDLQVNGAYGCDFAVEPSSIAPVAARLPETGVTGFLPTCITSPIESYAGWLEAATAAAEQAAQDARSARVPGVHLEGVYFNPHKAGAHNPALLRPVDVEEILTRYARHSSVRVVTLAPELPGALDAIRALNERGILVSAGHSNATYAEAEQAIAAGIRWGTHLFNAMHDLRHREPGLPAALLLSGVPVGLIVDGVHLHPAVVQLVYRLKGAGGVTLVTDAMAAMGNAPGTYNLGGYSVNVDEVSARLPNGTLAGSILTMDGAVRNMVAQSGCTPAEALRMASATPAALLGLERQGRIAPGCDADLVLLDGALRVQATLVRGEVVYRREKTP
jgi:N-acetylglucosamine-6-phosphate deacetylase